MKYRYLGLALLIMFPLGALGAGFAKQSLFLSKTPVTEGETVLIHAVVANEGALKFTGEVVFKDGEVKIGAVAVSIAPGGANAVSVSWKPTSGAHAIAAELTDEDGAVVERQSAHFTINEKLKPTSAAEATSTPVESSAQLQESIESTFPAIASFTGPIFSSLDSLRGQAAGMLDRGIEWAKEKSGGKKPSNILGSATDASQGGFMGAAGSILSTIALYLFSILRFIVGNAGIFYPFLAIAFLYGLWRTYKRMHRPSYEGNFN